MKSRHSPPRTRFDRLVAGLRPGMAAFLATLLALPVNAGITLPTDPLTTASRVPPNILFILDNSGSMQYSYMPDNVPDTSTPNVSDQAYTRNTVYYNPATTYQPWTKADSTLMTGGTDYGSVYSDALYVAYSGTGPTGTGTVSTSSGTTSLYSSVQTYYVPKNTDETSTSYESDAADGTKYYRYQILTSGRVQRAEYGTVAKTNTQTVTIDGNNTATGTLTNNSTVTLTLASVAADTTLSITISNTTTQNRTLNYAVQNPSGTQLTSGSVTRGNSTTYTVSPTVAGQYKVLLTRAGNNSTSYSVTASSYSSNACDSGANNGSQGWINCTYATPTGRTEAAERTNFATWYSYYRTRSKAAKAGASQAFAELGSDVRVGFRNIWGGDGSVTTGNIPTNSVPIPVNYNNGLFSDTGTSANANAFNNRTQWYNRLFSTNASNSTPLRDSLRDAGDYFGSSAATGPYGPDSGSNQLACRQNFSILTTDGYWNETNFSSSIGNADGTNGAVITNPTGGSYQYEATDPYQDGYSNTLADVAMYYWKTDLRSDLSDIVPTSSDDPAFWQHMVTFSIGLGLSGTVDQTSVDEVLANDSATVNGVKGWPQPVNNTITTIDDLLHAAVNGHGAYVAASDPDEFTAGLKAALAAVTERTGSFSNVAATSSKVTSSTQIFHASYVSNVWTGELLACPVNSASTCDSSNATWQASEHIPTTGRKIFTYDGTVGAATVGSTFPTDAQVSALGQENADYIAGDRSQELSNAGTLRNRNHLLGDIVTSSPTYVADINSVFVGANDGMLHAFDASTGVEQFAYVPGGIDLGNLATLSDPSYAHRYFVDGPTVVSTQKQTAGKNILAGTLGRGGKGLYALNVSDPTGFAATNVLWEDTETPNSNMGLVLGKPIIAKLNNGVMGLIVGNGINSTNEHAVLLVYNLETGALLKEIDADAGSTTANNGLFEPVGWNSDGDSDSNGNGSVDYVYAGDLQGNVWKFDLTGDSVADWEVSNGGDPLFTATNDSGVAQPITGGLTLALNPTTYKTWVFFGTGRFMTTGDMTDMTVQSLYGMVDAGSTVARTELTVRKVMYVTSSDGYNVRAFEANEDLPAGSKGWYINLLAPDDTPEGERIVSGAQMDGSNLVVSSIIPTADACQSDGEGYVNSLDAFTGTSVATAYFDLDGDGDAGNDTVTYTDEDGKEVTVPVGSVDLGVGMVTQSSLLTSELCASGSSGDTECVDKDDSRNVARVSWREVMKD